MFTISTIATPDPHHLLTLAHHRPCRVFPAGGRVPHFLAEAPAQLDGACALFALDGSDLFGLSVVLTLEGEVDGEQRARLADVAERTTVTLTLKQGVYSAGRKWKKARIRCSNWP